MIGDFRASDARTAAPAPAAAARPVFHLRRLFDPVYLVRRCRELGSAKRILRAAADVPRAVLGAGENAYYELRGLPGLLRARGLSAYYAARGPLHYASTRAERVSYELRGVPGLLRARGRGAYYALRGLPGLLRARAEGLYYKVDVPYYRSKLVGTLTPSPISAPAPAPAAPPPSFENTDPATLLRPEVRRAQASLAERFRTAEPFKHLVVDDFLDAEFCRRLVAEFPPYDAEAFRNEHSHLGKAYYEKVRELGPSYRKLDDLIQSADFLRFVSSVTGIPDLLYDPDYVGGGTHENLEEMELDPHVDFTVHKKTRLFRRVNLLFYLNPEWDEAWGGGLEIHTDPWLSAEKNRIKTIAPAFNRCVMFETSDRSWHGFKPIRLPEHKKGLTRRSFALYLYTREKPKDFLVIPGDLTVFVDRPLPPRFRPGLRLTEEDVRVLQHLIVRRDWKLRYLYERAISLYNSWQTSETRLKESVQSLLGLDKKSKPE